MSAIGRIYTQDFKSLKKESRRATILAIIALVVSVVGLFI